LALPPEMSDTFVKEVDENLRRDRIRDFSRDNAFLLIGAVVLFLVLCGGLIFWHQYRIRKTQQQVEKLAQIYTAVDAGNMRAAPQQLGELSNSGSKAVRGSAMFGRAAVALQQGQTKSAIAQYRAIHDDSGLPQPFRDLALIRQTALEFDSLRPADVVTRLKPLATPDSPWFGSAGELTGVALIKAGKTQEAAQLFAAMARSKSVPDAIRLRASQIASTFGIDVSGALPAAPAQ
jgi:hypothetical protein